MPTSSLSRRVFMRLCVICNRRNVSVENIAELSSFEAKRSASKSTNSTTSDEEMFAGRRNASVKDGVQRCFDVKRDCQSRAKHLKILFEETITDTRVGCMLKLI
jgi:hypothetical protein